MSVALSTRLGLHIDSSKLVAQKIMSEVTHEARKETFWAVFVVDRCVQMRPIGRSANRLHKVAFYDHGSTSFTQQAVDFYTSSHRAEAEPILAT